MSNNQKEKLLSNDVIQQFLERALKKGLIDQEDFNEGIQSLQSDKVTKTISDFEEMVEEDATNK